MDQEEADEGQQEVPSHTVPSGDALATYAGPIVPARNWLIALCSRQHHVRVVVFSIDMTMNVTTRFL